MRMRPALLPIALALALAACGAPSAIGESAARPFGRSNNAPRRFAEAVDAADAFAAQAQKDPRFWELAKWYAGHAYALPRPTADCFARDEPGYACTSDRLRPDEQAAFDRMKALLKRHVPAPEAETPKTWRFTGPAACAPLFRALEAVVTVAKPGEEPDRVVALASCALDVTATPKRASTCPKVLRYEMFCCESPPGGPACDCPMPVPRAVLGTGACTTWEEKGHLAIRGKLVTKRGATSRISYDFSKTHPRKALETPGAAPIPGAGDPTLDFAVLATPDQLVVAALPPYEGARRTEIFAEMRAAVLEADEPTGDPGGDGELLAACIPFLRQPAPDQATPLGDDAAAYARCAPYRREN
jgi:hypothetical protein